MGPTAPRGLRDPATTRSRRTRDHPQASASPVQFRRTYRRHWRRLDGPATARSYPAGNHHAQPPRPSGTTNPNEIHASRDSPRAHDISTDTASQAATIRR